MSVIICGDMNGTLIETRNNKHDTYMKDFVNEEKLICNMDRQVKTFVSHNGSSQIDHISFTTPGILNSVEIEEKHYFKSIRVYFS